MDKNKIDRASDELIPQLQRQDIGDLEANIRDDQAANTSLGDLEPEGVAEARLTQLEAIRIQRQDLDYLLDSVRSDNVASTETSGDNDDEQLDVGGVFAQTSDGNERSSLLSDGNQYDADDEFQDDSDVSDSTLSQWTKDLITALSNLAREEPSPDQDQRTQRCYLCAEEDIAIADQVQYPCGDMYCKYCVRETFAAAIKEERLYPPTCCGVAIPRTARIRDVLGDKMLQAYMDKMEEYETYKRTYCHRKTCSAFIPLHNVIVGQDSLYIATCPRCQSETCVRCAQEVHPGTGCPPDPDRQMLLDMASREGWKQCHGCDTMIELSTGCYHMTCRCGAEFCYLCATPWRNCSCPQSPEENLVARAEEAVGRDPDAALITAYAHRAQVQRERANWLAHREWRGHNWVSRRGGHQCEICRDHMSRFINECRYCRLMACNRCRRIRHCGA